METTVDAAAARAALAEVVPRLTALIRSVRNPDAHAVGEWNAGDVALHLAHAWETVPALAGGERDSPIQRVGELAGFTKGLVRGEPGRDLEAAAARIEKAAAAFLDTPADGEPRPWLLEGTSLPRVAFSCHLLNESLVHGHDIARADRRPWRIEQAHAGMAIMGFVLPALAVVDPRELVDQRRAGHLRACFDMRVRRTGRFFMVIEDGTMRIEAPSDRPVDWHLSAEPATIFLVIWHRTGPWQGLLTGRMTGWGRHPLLGLRLPTLVRSP